MQCNHTVFKAVNKMKKVFFCYLVGANQAPSADIQQGNQQESDELYALQWFQEQILQKANTYKKCVMWHYA